MWFKRKQKPKTTYRIKTPKQRAEELLEKAWLKDLTEHPEFAREIARQKYGVFGGESEGQYVGEPPPDLLDVLKQAKEAKELLRDEVAGEKQGWISIIPDVMKALPDAIRGLKELQGAIPLPEKPPPKRIEQPPTREQQLISFAEQFTSLKPEEAALELYQNKDTEDDVRAILWQTALNSTADDLFAMLPMLESMPDYQFLRPFAQKLTTKRGKQWVALVLDECNRLNEGEITPESTD